MFKVWKVTQKFFDTQDVESVTPGGKLSSDTDERKFLDDKDDDKEDKVDDDKKDDEEEEDDPDKVDDDKVDDDKEDEDDEDEDKEDKEKDDEEDEEDEEDNSDEVISKLKALDTRLKKDDPKFKGLLKEIPELRQVIYRERQYTEEFPSIEDAKEAKEAAETFAIFQSEIVEGNPENIFVAVKEMGAEKLKSLAANLLPSLEKVDKSLYQDLIAGEIKKFLRSAHAMGKRDNNKNMILSAENLHWFIFGDTNLDKEVGLKPTKVEPTEREKALEERERRLEERAFKSFATDVYSTTKGSLTKAIIKTFKDSDIPEWTQKKLAGDIYDRIEDALKKDVRHVANMKNLWTKAQKDGFSSEHKDSIIPAYLSRAKALIPTIRRQVLEEAKVSASRTNKDKREPVRVPSGSNSSNRSVSSNNPKAKDVDWEKTDERSLLDDKQPVMKSRS